MRVIEFFAGELGPAVTAVEELRVGRQGWINLTPALPDQARPPAPSVLGQFFSTRGRIVPLVTITPGRTRRDGTVSATTVGLEHGLGERVRPWLAARGHTAPGAWQLKQDHPKRGIVWEIGPEVETASTVAWLVDLADGICPIETDGRWHAEIHP